MLFHNLYSHYQDQLLACLHIVIIELTHSNQTENKYKQKTKYTYYKSLLKESMKGSWYEQDGLPHERSSENVTSSTSCNQRKPIDWHTKNESSGNEDSYSGSEEEIYQYLTGL